MSFNKLGIATIIASIVLIASGCNGTKKPADPVEIHYQVGFPKGLEGFTDKTIISAAANFHTLNPQITVKLDYLESVDLMTPNRDIELLEGDEPQDIISADIHLAEKKGLLLDLFPLQKSSEKTLDINQRILDRATVNGKLLMLPFGAYPMVIMYNKDIFDAAHIPYPQGEWTWEQFRELSKKIKTESASGSALTYDPVTFEILMGSTGKHILSPDGKTSIGFLDSPEAISTIQWLNAYYQDDDHKPAPQKRFDDFRLFNDKQIGMIITLTTSNFASFQGEDTKKLGIAPLPYFESGERASWVGLSGLSISQKSKHPEEAWKFIEYLTLENNEDSVQFANGGVLTSKTVADAAGQSADPNMQVSIDEMNYVAKSSTDFNPLISQAWNEELTAQFQGLFATSDQEIPIKLHKLALKLDQELKRLKSLKD